MSNLITKFIQIGDNTYDVGYSKNNLTDELLEQFSAAQANILDGVKVNGAALAIANKMVDILIAESATNGSIKVNNVDVPIHGLAALAYKAEISEAELSAALKAVINAKAAQSDLDNLTTAFNTLKGDLTGSVDAAITAAFNKFTTDVTNDSVVNSYKELIDWAAAHGSEAAEMAGAISNLEGLLAGIGGQDEPATVMAAIQAAVNAVSIGNYYTKTETDGLLGGKVDKVEGKGLSTKDFTAAYETKLNGISAEANKVTFSHNDATKTLVITIA